MENQRSRILFLLFVVLNASISNSALIGVNYGQLGSNLPYPEKSIEIIKKLGAKMVKIYDANPRILNALSKTKLQVSIMVPNELVADFSSNENLTCKWIEQNLLPYYKTTRIRFLLVANEFTSVSPKQDWSYLVPAMRNMMKALQKYRVKKVKIGTTLAMDVLESSYPPSKGSFKSDLLDPVIKPLLEFASKSKSFFFLDAYPFFPYKDKRSIKEEYALLSSDDVVVTDPGSGLGYTNLLDAMVDSVYQAMDRVGFPGVRICLAETGWPHSGDFGASIKNAATYNRNLVKKLVRSKPGTPLRPGSVIPTFIFALYDENQKRGPDTERHWGLFAPEGSPNYPLDLTGKTTSYPPFPVQEFWCVLADQTAHPYNQTAIDAAVSWACAQKMVNCAPTLNGNPCSGPHNRPNYAFSAYWAQYNSKHGTCDFDGLAALTQSDPGTKACQIPSVRF